MGFTSGKNGGPSKKSSKCSRKTNNAVGIWDLFAMENGQRKKKKFLQGGGNDVCREKVFTNWTNDLKKVKLSQKLILTKVLGFDY